MPASSSSSTQHQRLEAVAFEDLRRRLAGIGGDHAQLRAVDAAVEQLAGHLVERLHIADVLLLLDLEQRRPGDVDVALLDQLRIWR